MTAAIIAQQAVNGIVLGSPYVLVALGLIAAMPIAGSATAWSQKSNGDLSLSLGLVLGSTLLSMWTTPLTLRAVGW